MLRRPQTTERPMSRHVLLLSDAMHERLSSRIAGIARDAHAELSMLPLSAAGDPAGPLAAVTCAWYSRDLLGRGPREPGGPTERFFAAVDRAPALRWLHVMSAGTDMPTYRASLDRGVSLTTASGVTARPIAQTVVAALLSHARGVPHWLDAQRRAEWAPRLGDAAPRDLDDQVAVVVGLGPIGREVARLLRAIGLRRVVGVRLRDEAMDEVDATTTYDRIDAVLPDCDWLVLCCPLSDATLRLVDARRLALLPARARVINVGRGPLLDEAALVDALRAGRLAGAYLDVFECEPLPPDSPLWALPNVWLSPHNSAASSGNARRDVEVFLARLGSWLRAPG